MASIYNDNVTGVILAGGKARRMGGCDKGLVKINGKSMVSYVIEALRPQVKTILINANRSVAEYTQLGFEVVSDQLDDFQGPLAGIAVAMSHAKTKYICTCPCDGPLLAIDLVSRLASAFEDNITEIAVAHDGKRMQPVYAILDCSLQKSLLHYLSSGERKIDRWYAQHHYKEVDFSDNQDCFININTPEEQALIEEKLSK